jgi:hypothetical protein
VLLRFFTQGIVHIVPKGLDHVLFICALVLGIGTRLRRLVLLLSGFTVAHTLTLGLGALGFQPIPSAIVEVFIAMSIAWVGMQSAWSGSKGEVLTLGVLGFGLLHGMGFAGALSEIAVPKDFLLLSLLGFNLGVELGQLIVVAWAALVVDLVRRITVSHEEWMRAASFGIAACGLFWTAERVIFAFS